MPLEEVLKAVPQGFYQDHRGGDFGSLEVKVPAGQHVQYVTRTPYPDDYWYGVTHGLMIRYAVPQHQFTVKYDDAVLRRDLGGEMTIIDVQWNLRTSKP